MYLFEFGINCAYIAFGSIYMHEKVQAKLSGQVYEGRSSDSAIARNIEQIKSSINATQGEILELDVDGDIYPPVPVVGSGTLNDDEELIVNQRVIQLKNLSHYDSAFAKGKFLERLEKKAA